VPSAARKHTGAKENGGPSRTIWAYAFRIAPAQTKSRLRAVGALLDEAHLAAKHGARTLTGRVMPGAQATRILIVSDSLVRSRKVNRQLVAEFKRLGLDFSVTEPVELPGSGGLGRRRNAKRKPTNGRKPAP
jgi:hypothetical protein